MVYEIGPGRGIITAELEDKCTRVIAIEKDRKLYEYLVQKFADRSKVKIILGDFLSYQLPRDKKYKIFSNIPFNITADIIKRLTSVENPPEDAYLIVQREAAVKFAGSAYGKERLDSLLIKPWLELNIIHEFKRTDFDPAPRVDIVLLRIKKRAKPLVNNSQAVLYKDFVVYGFSQWKSSLKKSLDKIFTYDQFKRLAKDLSFSITAVPTDLDLEQWLGLFNYFAEGVEDNKKQLIRGAWNKWQKQETRLQKVHRTR